MNANKSLIATLCVAFIAAVLYWLLLTPDSQTDGPNTEPGQQVEQVDEPVSTSTELAAATDVQRSVIRPHAVQDDAALESGLSLTVILRNANGDVLLDGRVRLYLESERLSGRPDWESPDDSGQFHLPRPSAPAWIHAQATGCWSTQLAWTPKDSNSVEITLLPVTRYQDFLCVDFESKRPLAGVMLRNISRHTPPKPLWGGTVISDANGIAQLPIGEHDYFEVEFENAAALGYAKGEYEIYSSTTALPFFRESNMYVFAMKEGAELLPDATIGVDWHYFRDMESFYALVDFPIQQAESSSNQPIMLSLPSGLEQTIWAEHADYGRATQTVTPTAGVGDVVLKLEKSNPLVIKVDLPSGIDPQTLTLSMHGKDRKVVDVPIGDDGLFTIPMPAITRALLFNADGCMLIRGYLRDRRLKDDATNSGANGFIHLTMQRGHDVSGKAQFTDGSPAQCRAYLWPADVEAPPVIRADQSAASAWDWMQDTPELIVELGKGGSFKFHGVPTGEYVLRQMLPNGKRAEAGAYCTLVMYEDWVVVPNASELSIHLPRLQNATVRVFNAETKAALQNFFIQHDSPADGNVSAAYGLTGDSDNGVFTGYIPVDELKEIRAESDGYISKTLDQGEVKGSEELWEIDLALTPIKPGTITAIFDLPTAPNATGESAKPTLKLGIKVELKSSGDWRQYFHLSSNQSQSMMIPVEDTARLKFSLRDKELQKDFRLEPENWTYHPGQDVVISLIPIKE